MTPVKELAAVAASLEHEIAPVSQGHRVRHLPLVVLLLVVVFSRDVYAYLDPGTGSLIFQTVVAALAAAAYAFRSYWGKIRTLFGRNPSRSSGEHTSRG